MSDRDHDSAFRIRPCLEADMDAAYEVCLKTGDSGADGTHLYRDDPSALGHLYVGPYLVFEPDLAFVLEDGAGVCGYVLAARDSACFYQRFLTEWLPPLRARFPDPGGDPAAWTPVEQLYHEYHHYEVYYPQSFRAYPSHLHIDLLPRAQGCGQGGRLMRHQLAALERHSSPGVHLCMSAANHRAYRFYCKLRFHELARAGIGDAEVIYMGKRLAEHLSLD